MSNLDRQVLDNFIKEMSDLCYDVKDLEIFNIWKFRYICYKLNYFMKHIPLPHIKENNYYEAVFIDFRELPNMEFILRNSILKLGKNWSFTIICGNNNYNYMLNIKNNISKNIKIIKINYDNLSNSDYSTLLMSKEFWNLLCGEKILIFQEDSLIFHSNISPFLNYDFIGAPFLKNSNDTPNGVGNGGISLRTKCKMLDVINTCRIEETVINSSTKNYMDIFNLKVIPEDIYFSKNMQEKSIGDVADWNTASNFSSEQVFNPDSFAGHKFWISNENWQYFLKKIFGFKKYSAKSDLNKFLKFKHKNFDLNNNDKILNAFDIDLELFCCVNNIKYINDSTALEYINTIGLDGFIYHPKQLYNIFDNLELYKFLDNIYAFYNKNTYTIQDFANKYIYNTSFDYISDILIEKKYDTLNDNYETILLVFLGNENVGVDLLNRIISYKNINNEFNIGFCINRKEVKNLKPIKKLISENFDFYSIYYSKECGTDITPTLLMYNDIIKTHNFKHILKLHTKTISNLYNELTDFLLLNPINKIISQKRRYSNCIGPDNMYQNILNDKFNNILKNKYKNKINLTYSFVIGTIFYTDNITFNKVLEFVKNNNYKSFLLNNLYENNSINYNFSPIHFLERLFGSIKQ